MTLANETGRQSPTGAAAVDLAVLIESLVRNGVLSASDVVEGGICFSQVGRSNGVLRLEVGNRPFLFVKTFAESHPQRAEALARERAAQQLALGAGGTLGGAIPAPIFLSDDPSWLIWRAAEGGSAWFDTQLPSEEILRLMGAALGRLHSSNCQAFAALPSTLPWILRLGISPLPDNLARDAGATRMIARLLERPVIVAGLGEMASLWQATHPIHGDAKSDNMIVSDGAEPKITLIDWELAGLGDPAWDLAGALLKAALELPQMAPREWPGYLANNAVALWTDYPEPLTLALAQRFTLCLAAWLAQTSVQFSSDSMPEAASDSLPPAFAETLFEMRDEIVQAIMVSVGKTA